MSNFKNLIQLLSLSILVFSLNSCEDDDGNVTPTPPGSNTFEIIAESPNHEILEQALLDTGLDEALNDGVYTVFAPTDDAFSGVDLSGLNNEQLSNILLNHVLNGEIFFQPPAGSTQTTLSTGYFNSLATEKITGNNNSMNMYVSVDDNVVVNGNSTVSTPDLNANNGVVHVVDQVITLPDVTTFAVADPTFDNLQAALTRDDQPDFVGTLSTPNGTDPAPFTVFAPTNDAFGALLNELGLDNLADVPQQTLTSTLNSHVIAGANVRAADLTDETVQSLEAELDIDASESTITDPNGRVSNIIVTDVQAANGVIHAIDQVILPQQ
jgi:transforming growth factor-beta-induced protein